MAWPNATQFASWLCLAPGNKISGGKILSAGTRQSSSRTAPLLRLAATTVGRTETALGACYRRLSSRVGRAKAVTSTARKMAVLFYNALRNGMKYKDPAAHHDEERYRARVLMNLQHRARTLGYALQRIPNGEAVAWQGPTSRTPVLRAITSRQRTIVRRNRAELKTTGPWLPCSKTTARSDQFVAYTHSTAQSGELL